MKFLRKIPLLAIAFALAWLAIYAYNRFTDGFSIRQITSTVPANPRFETAPLSSEETSKLQALFSQPFRYLGKGCQFYAFESADGKYVVKFFKHKHLRSFAWLRSLPLPERLKQKAEGVIAKREARIDNLFTSCKLAYEVLPKETGLVFIHLNRRPLLQTKLTLIDKLGLKQTIQLDDYEFVLQKKGLSLQQVFGNLSSPEEAEQRIQQLIDLVWARCELGVADQDHAFAQNVAFCEEENRPVFIDIGQFYQLPQPLSQEEKQAELQKRLRSLRFWMSQHFPDLVHYIDAHLES